MWVFIKVILFHYHFEGWRKHYNLKGYNVPVIYSQFLKLYTFAFVGTLYQEDINLFIRNYEDSDSY